VDFNIVVLCSFFYLLGSIPFGLILGKLFGFGDVRKFGSGNFGATNVLRTGSKSLALLVLFLDVAKGILPLFILENLNILDYPVTLIYFICCLPIIGHIFPVWLKFNGGKGVATYIGFLLSVNYLIAATFILFWLLIALISKYSSLASILSLIIILPISIYLSIEKEIIYIFSFISIVIIIKHFSNILRLFNKTENKISF
tara:strand:+ start:75 stop:674 length:600 start_codon:yes stop_codon:yes gene_type:complete